MSNIEENVQDQRLAHRINIRQPKPLVFGKNMAQEWKNVESVVQLVLKSNTVG